MGEDDLRKGASRAKRTRSVRPSVLPLFAVNHHPSWQIVLGGVRTGNEKPGKNSCIGPDARSFGRSLSLHRRQRSVLPTHDGNDVLLRQIFVTDGFRSRGFGLSEIRILSPSNEDESFARIHVPAPVASPFHDLFNFVRVYVYALHTRCVACAPCLNSKPIRFRVERTR